MRWTQAKMREMAQEERAALGLTPFQALDPYALAEEHGIPVYPIDELPDGVCTVDAVEHFTVHRQKTWSAAIIPVGSARIIIENTAHPLVRRRSSIGHELGHHLLEHQFDEMLLTDDGCRRFDAAKEKQATFVAGELLVPEAAAKRAAFADMSNEDVAAKFGVSTQFAQMRMYGPRVLVENTRRKQAAGR